jgi:hypothetical protein
MMSLDIGLCPALIILSQSKCFNAGRQTYENGHHDDYAAHFIAPGIFSRHY